MSIAYSVEVMSQTGRQVTVVEGLRRARVAAKEESHHSADWSVGVFAAGNRPVAAFRNGRKTTRFHWY